MAVSAIPDSTIDGIPALSISRYRSRGASDESGETTYVVAFVDKDTESEGFSFRLTYSTAEDDREIYEPAWPGLVSEKDMASAVSRFEGRQIESNLSCRFQFSTDDYYSAFFRLPVSFDIDSNHDLVLRGVRGSKMTAEDELIFDFTIDLSEADSIWARISRAALTDYSSRSIQSLLRESRTLVSDLIRPIHELEEEVHG